MKPTDETKKNIRHDGPNTPIVGDSTPTRINVRVRNASSTRALNDDTPPPRRPGYAARTMDQRTAYNPPRAQASAADTTLTEPTPDTLSQPDDSISAVPTHTAASAEGQSTSTNSPQPDQPPSRWQQLRQQVRPGARRYIPGFRRTARAATRWLQSHLRTLPARTRAGAKSFLMASGHFMREAPALTVRTIKNAPSATLHLIRSTPAFLRSLPSRLGQLGKTYFFPFLSGVLISAAIIPFLVMSAQAATAELVPDSDVSIGWPTSTGASHYTEVDEGSATPDTNTYFASDNTDNTDYTNEFSVTNQANIDSATQITLRIYANTTISGSGVDTVTLDARINGTLLGGQTVTPSQGSYAWRDVTWTGTWTQADIDSLQVSMTRNVVGGGNPNGRGDEIRIATVTVDLTYTSAVTLEQSSYRWFDNDNSAAELPLQMSELDSYTSVNLDSATGVHIDGTTAYVASALADSLTSIDISDPSAMVELDSITSTSLDSARSVAISGTTAYVTSFLADSLTSIDISDPSAMVELDSITSTSLDGAQDIYIDGTIAYVASVVGNSITSIDISNPSAMVELDSITSPSLANAGGVYVAGTTAFVASSNADSLTAIDISNPSAMVELDSITSLNLEGAADVHISDTTAYVASLFADSLTAIDISNPSAMVELDSYSSVSLGTAYNVTITGTTAYVASNSADSLTAIDISNPSALTELDSYTSLSLDGARSVHIDGTTAYVASNDADSLTAVDISIQFEAGIGSSLATQDTPVEAPAEGTPFRLRASVSASLGELGAGAGNYKLQYAELGPEAICTLDFTGGEVYEDVYPVGGEYIPQQWTEETASAPWASRRFHTKLVYDNKIWVMGGIGESNVRYNDVWYSEDGVTWTEATANAGWDPRNQHTSVVYDGKMWVMGGVNSLTTFNDVWYSEDGVTWTEATASADWIPNYGHKTLTYDNKMWHIGGYDDATNTYLNEVWSSTDGITWVEETPSAGWTGRSNLGTVVYDGKMWVIGGGTGSGGFDDSWYSTDGINWTEASASAPWSARNNFGITVVKGVIYLYGGFDGGYNNDIWSTSDGVTWTEELSAAPWTGRNGHKAVLFDDRVYLSGGTTNGTDRLNDVWSSPIVTSIVNFYDNQNIPDGAGIAASLDDPNPGLGNKVLQSYVESNNFTNPNTIPDGDYGVWDFALVDNGAETLDTYCFRIVASSGDQLQSYSVIPELSIPPPTIEQLDYRWYRNAQPLIWSPAAGWINLGAPGGGVRVYDDHLEGYAWSENLDWIRLGTHTTGGSHTYGNTSETNYGVNRDPVTGELSGFAWSPSAGWINFSPSFGGGVSYNNEDYSGYAWAENFSWIDTSAGSGNYLLDNLQQETSSGYAPPVSSPRAAQTTRAVLDEQGSGSQLRLRLLLQVSDKDLSTDLEQYKLQYALAFGNSCSVDFTGETYFDMDATTTDVRFFDNLFADGSSVLIQSDNDPTAANPVVAQTYEETNPFSNSAGVVPAGSVAMFDFAVQDATTAAGLYCFRVVRDDGSMLQSYSQIPELLTPPATRQFLRHGRFFDESGNARPFFW